MLILLFKVKFNSTVIIKVTDTLLQVFIMVILLNF